MSKKNSNRNTPKTQSQNAHAKSNENENENENVSNVSESIEFEQTVLGKVPADKWLLWTGIVCVAFALADFLYRSSHDWHPHNKFEKFFNFFGFAAIIATLAVALTSNLLKNFLSRNEAYYDE